MAGTHCSHEGRKPGFLYHKRPICSGHARSKIGLFLRVAAAKFCKVSAGDCAENFEIVMGTAQHELSLRCKQRFRARVNQSTEYQQHRNRAAAAASGTHSKCVQSTKILSLIISEIKRYNRKLRVVYAVPRITQKV